MTTKLASLHRTSFDFLTAAAIRSPDRIEPAAPVGDREHLDPSSIAELVGAGPPVDHEKVAQIRQAIAAGAYRIDAKAIADAMIDAGA